MQVGQARRGLETFDDAWQVRRGEVGLGLMRPSSAGMALQGKDGVVGQDRAGVEGRGVVGQGKARTGLVRRGMVRQARSRRLINEIFNTKRADTIN